jgi:hypothetical protein
MTRYRALLDALARPRLVGSPHHTAVRDMLRRELTERGFVVLDHRFQAAARFPLRGGAPSEGINLIAVRPRVRITTWLAAHYDSKGQPLSMAGRLLWVATSLLALPVVLAVTLMGLVSAWWWLAVLVLPFGFLVLNVATDRSPGAVDNATGVLTVLATLDQLPSDAAVGAILLDAEELGLVGARALARERANLLHDTALINFDGIDDRGAVIALEHKAGQLVQALAARLDARPRRRFPVVVDGLALADATRECMTIMKGDWETTRVIHTPRDTTERLTLIGVEGLSRDVASVLSPGP